MQLFLCVLATFATSLAVPKPPTRIIGGTDATAGEFPWQISYQWNFIGVWEHICGGSILNSTTIVTAGHCVTNIPIIGQFRIIAGIIDLDQTDGQIINVIDKVVHPEFLGRPGPNDIALLRLEKELEFNNVVKPISLPQNSSVATGTAILSGWGDINDGIIPIMPMRLQKAELPILEFEECKKMVDQISQKNPLDVNSNMCTGSLTGGVSSCKGDNGGPLVQNDILVGIVSWGVKPCGGAGNPSVYTKVSSFLDFIVENLE